MGLRLCMEGCCSGGRIYQIYSRVTSETLCTPSHVTVLTIHSSPVLGGWLRFGYVWAIDSSEICMCMCICIFIYIYMYVCMYVNTCIYTYAYACMHICMHACLDR